MNKKTEKFFESLELPEIQLHSHQEALRKQLLKIHKQQTQKGGEVTFMKRKLFRYGAIGVISLALVVAFGITTILPKTPQVQAQEIVNDVMDRVIKLSDEERKAIEGKIKADLESSLEEAKQAKDLTVVPESEIERIDLPKGKPGEKKDLFMAKPIDKKEMGERHIVGGESQPGSSTGGIGNGTPGEKVIGGEIAIGNRVQFPGKIMAPHGVKVLRYTSPEGNKVILGINEKNEPVLKMMLISKEDGKKLEQTDVHFEQAL